LLALHQEGAGVTARPLRLVEPGESRHPGNDRLLEATPGNGGGLTLTLRFRDNEYLDGMTRFGITLRRQQVRSLRQFLTRIET
jgi:hypothetical protein